MVETLAERLGYDADSRLVILCCDDFGTTRSANDATLQALSFGAATSASLMVPGPWARDAAARYRGEDVGVHLALNAEWDTFRWGPITHSPSLLDGIGGFPKTRDDIWEHADLDEVAKECRAQIERAIYWGFDVTHLTSHMATLNLRPDFFDVLLTLAVEFRLPVRLQSRDVISRQGVPYRQIAEAADVVFPDFVRTSRGRTAAEVADLIRHAPGGVTELRFHPGLDTAELRAACNDWEFRVADHLRLNGDAEIRKALLDVGAITIGWEALRRLQRGAAVSAS